MLRIRNIDVLNDVALAPMEGVTDITFRTLVRQIGGCGLVFTEFVPARGLAEQHDRVLELVELDPAEHPIGVQLFGRDPDLLADGARMAVDLGADLIDLNMGCPSKKVCANSGGSSLLKEPDHARRLVAAIRAAVSIPFTVKMRSGWDPSHKNAPEIARMCEGEGAEAVTVHWRTRADGYGGVRELDTIARVKSLLRIPVIANGDIVDPETAFATRAATGCDGWMIGRGAIQNPWVFRQLGDALAGRPVREPTFDEREATLLDYYAAVRERFDTDKAALGRMKKIIRYFADGVDEGEALRRAVFHSGSIDEVTARVREFFDAKRSGLALA
jgi:tRNA-dihydrouridine synthase B